jgi:hypothetical protein
LNILEHTALERTLQLPAIYPKNACMKRKTPKKEFPARRKFNLRRDASVASGQRTIEQVFGLPEGSVRLHLPSGRPARADKSIAAFLDDYDRS